MHWNALWPLLSLLAAVIAFVPAVADSGHRSVVYWLVIPPLVAGILAAWSHFGVL
jgi:hypothetical protein